MPFLTRIPDIRPYISKFRPRKLLVGVLTHYLAARKMEIRTVTSLKRWSCQDQDLPAPQQIKNIHVYDFDNTLFMSPLPNNQIWSGMAMSQLSRQDGFVNGGWWHDSRILAATGKGLEHEESRAWEGWWNEDIVSLVKLSMRQKDALNVLLTGRSESDFAHLIKRMLASKQLDFDMICLKPEVGPRNQRFPTTMIFKQALLDDLLHTYTAAEELRIYEDRLKHVDLFRSHFDKLNRSLINTVEPSPRMPFKAEVVEVSEVATTLDPVTEIQEVQRMINDHNASVSQGAPTQSGRQCIKRNVRYTGYLLSQSATDLLLSVVRLPSDNNIRVLANSILITSRPCSRPILEKVGGVGNTVRWRVTSVGSFGDKIWGATVKPIPESTRVFTENRPATIVLALRRSARPADVTNIRHWQPLSPEERHEFDTVVGEKVLLQIEEEARAKPQWQRLPWFNSKRKFAGYTDEMDVDPSPASTSGPERFSRLEAPTAPAGHGGLTTHHHHHHHHQHQLPPKPPASYRDENMPPAHHHHHHQHQPQQQQHHRYQQNPSANSRGRGVGRGNRGGGSYRGARGDRGGAGGGGRGRHRGSGAPYSYRSLDDSPMERNHPDTSLSASSYSLDGAGDARRGSDAIGVGIGTGGHNVTVNGNGTPGEVPGPGVMLRYHQDGAPGGIDDMQYN